MKARDVQCIICLVIIFLYANHAWAAKWIYYTSTSHRDAYYDKNTVIKLDNNIIQVWAKTILNKNGKKETFSYLKRIERMPDNPDILSHVLVLHEIDCVKEKYKDLYMSIYDDKNNIIYSSPNGKTGKWNNILPNSVGIILKNIVCEEPIAPKEAVVASSAVTDKNLVQVNGKQNETKASPQEVVRNLITKWLNSWKSGDMESYRSCYASEFKSKGMNLDAWVSHKTSVYRKSKSIDISIDKLQISMEENNATAVFSQYYSSSILKDSGKKKLELRKINDEWIIYREIMQP